MAGRIGFEFSLRAGGKRERARPEPESAMRILVLGDFAGRSHRGAHGPELATRKPAAIDVDNFDRVMARIGPRLELPVRGGEMVTLEFNTLEDFHPDTLYRRLAVFEALREIRRRLQNPATFADAAAQLRSRTQRAIAPAEAGREDAGARGDEPDAELFARLLGGTPPAATPAAQAGNAGEARLQALIREVVQPHIVPGAPAHQGLYIAAVDAEIAAQMRELVQAPQFKALEALWRGVDSLVSNLETDESLQLFLLDVSREELLADMQAGAGSSGLHRLLVEQGTGTVGGEPWSLIVANEAFGLAEEDVRLLAHLGAVAAHAGGPLLAAAKPDLIGCESIVATPDPRDWSAPAADAAEAWNALRESSIAEWIGLALPRVLLRQPYGKRSHPIQSFAFEELEPQRSHEAYLWGNGAFACALLIGRAFSANGWGMEPGDELDLEDLPAHTYEEAAEKHLQACAEAYLAERAAQAILDAGLMPLLSFKNRNAVRVMRFQSIATPAMALNGPWALAQE